MKKLIIIPFLFVLASLSGQTAVFSSNFEDNNTTAEVGTAQLETGTSGDFAVVANPSSDSRNSSTYVLRVRTQTGTGGRAEYSTQRINTGEQTIIYKWSRFHATNMFTDIVITGWVNNNQWKTWPCEYYGEGQYDFSDEICYARGIFNETDLQADGTYSYLARANPDCQIWETNQAFGIWNDFVLEIYWTETSSGYYKLWKNDVLIAEASSVQTLFTGFMESTCDIYWTNGLYTYWDKTGAQTQNYLVDYVDDVAVYNEATSGNTIDNLCPTCEGVGAESSENDITVFAVTGQSGSTTINATNHTVTLQMPYGTNLTSLSPTISVSAGATINPTSGTARNFSSAVTYTVTAEDATQQVWTVTITNVAASTLNNITSFSIAGQTGGSTINSTNHTVVLTMPYNTNRASLTPTIGVSVGATISPTSGTARNFTSPVDYTVTAQDGTSTQVWSVTVNLASVPSGTNHKVYKNKGKTLRHNGIFKFY